MYDEQAEDLENPLRCPIKLYDYYLFKWQVALRSFNLMLLESPSKSQIWVSKYSSVDIWVFNTHFWVLTLLLFLQPSKHKGTQRCLLHDARDCGGAQQPHVVLVSASHKSAGGADALSHHCSARDPGDHPRWSTKLERTGWTPDMFTSRLCSIHTASASQQMEIHKTTITISHRVYDNICSWLLFLPLQWEGLPPAFASLALKAPLQEIEARRCCGAQLTRGGECLSGSVRIFIPPPL